jgi:hypothetical protein
MLGRNYTPKTSSASVLAGIMNDQITRHDKRMDTDYSDALTATNRADNIANTKYTNAENKRKTNVNMIDTMADNERADRESARKILSGGLSGLSKTESLNNIRNLSIQNGAGKKISIYTDDGLKTAYKNYGSKYPETLVNEIVNANIDDDVKVAYLEKLASQPRFLRDYRKYTGQEFSLD